MSNNYPLIGGYIDVPDRSEDAKVEKYKIIQGVGKGGFGTVYLGRSCKTGDQVAIKVIDLAAGCDARDRADNEISIHVSLSHQNILRIHSSCEIGKAFYLFLEFCENGNLKNYLERQPGGKLPESEARKFLDQIVQGLDYLHKQKVLHGDISLNNLLLTKKFTIKIADFGLASKLYHPSYLKQVVCGQRNYMAPEKAKKKLYSFPSDIWSVGCVLCHMITGKSPFASKLTSEKISPAALDLLSKMLLNDPDQRITLAEIHKHLFLTNYDKYKIDHQPISAMDSGIETNASSSSPSLSNNLPFYSRRKSPQTTISGYSPRFAEKPLQPYNLGDDNENVRKLFHLKIDNSANVTLYPSSRSNTSKLNVNGYLNKQHGLNFDVPRQNRQDLEIRRSQSCNRSYNQRPINSENRSHSNVSAGQINYSQPNNPKFNADKSLKNPICTYPLSSSELLSSRPGSRQNNSKTEERPMLPLSTNRLSPQEYSTKKGNKKSVKILDTGHVLVEIAKKTDPKVFDCCEISADGNTIVAYERVRDERFKKNEFSFESLPPKHFYKYNTAIKFCSMVGSRTLKIRHRHQLAKFELMENGDFKAVGLYDTKEIILSKGDNMISITYTDGGKVQAPLANLPRDSLLDKFKEFHEGCLEIEKSVTRFDPGCFPLRMNSNKVNSTKILANKVNSKENLNLRR